MRWSFVKRYMTSDEKESWFGRTCPISFDRSIHKFLPIHPSGTLFGTHWHRSDFLVKILVVARHPDNQIDRVLALVRPNNKDTRTSSSKISKHTKNLENKNKKKQGNQDKNQKQSALIYKILELSSDESTLDKMYTIYMNAPMNANVGMLSRQGFEQCANLRRAFRNRYK